jgi:glycosyltransferase involved in cell wall biosynthesis
LAVGRLTVEKDYPTLIKAFSILSEKNNFRLIILGEGKKRSELESLIKRLELQEKIDLPGFTRNPYVYMRNCDIFVLSSATEGFPNTLIEAMACGTPVVSTDCPSGPREILDNGKFGKLVKVGDEKSLAEAILETIKNPLSSEELINRVREKFSLKEAIKKYLDIIRNI